MEQERLDALFADEMDIQNVQELYDGLWDKRNTNSAYSTGR